jgi:hypothetical protein
MNYILLLKGTLIAKRSRTGNRSSMSGTPPLAAAFHEAQDINEPPGISSRAASAWEMDGEK